MDPLRSIRNEFANGSPTHCHFYAVWTSRHESSMIPKALKFATLQKKMAPIPPPYLSFYGRLYGGICVTSKRNRHCRRSQTTHTLGS